MEGFVKIDEHSKNEISAFINNAGNSLEKFRYYNSRPIDTIKNHLVTYLYYCNNIPVAYGHLDKEDGTVWLGIAVAEKYTGKGIGKNMMQKLISYADVHNIDTIKLSVDRNNEQAIMMYTLFGFECTEEKNETLFFKKLINSDK
jgi:ribosomal protein S18 acetylase RimI-like enzyme